MPGFFNRALNRVGLACRIAIRDHRIPLRSSLVIGAVALVSSAAAIPALAVYGQVTNGGSYRGSQQNGFPISFSVASDGRNVNNGNTWIEAGCGGNPVKVHFTRLALSSAGFSGRHGRGTAIVQGHFRSHGRARGLVTWHVSVNGTCSSTKRFTAKG